ncbi:aldo/keto reductase [Zobellia galactanivorans]|uniref:Aldo/keto reductase related to aryl-alcohol dehydrogenases n=1 Tax=Zobellia galactanivorans (strain DSM 12802 / CCUG 47099 / CIP 106680 / NCIMB 13871 / Dsij) TaxID=63186 RepID=G0L2N6_ZOBGA|nr:aldo/keto reductase [Zobellia galactanivorans]MBU3025266.1 aldo/keto reductase [Zobellia galactanivorans]CAZ95095.1 Aldo/keto reductase related to aryl-alcohol dehydrogenases [Zobellia galactanivorans]
MEYRTLGRTGWKVSEIGFGGWQLGGTWGRVDNRESVDTLLYAFEQGINFVDTAFAYGKGRSEEVIGKALKEWSGDKIYVATKVTPVKQEMTTLDVDGNPPIKGRYPEWYIRQMVEGSLRRLGVERLDLLQLHLWFESGVYELEWLETLNALRLEGKIDKIGVSLADIRPNQGVDLAQLGLVDTIQVMFNIFEQQPMDELFPMGKTTNTGFIARVPLDSGALTGTWTDASYSEWGVEDKRHAMYHGSRFKKTLQRIEDIKNVCQPFYNKLADAALRYALHPEEVGLIIPGMRNKNEVDLNIAISDGAKFPEELANSLKSHRWKHEFYD